MYHGFTNKRRPFHVLARGKASGFRVALEWGLQLSP